MELAGLPNRKLLEIAQRSLGIRPCQVDGNAWQGLNSIVRGMEWFCVYDYLERVYDHLSRPEKMYVSREAARAKASSFEDQISAYLVHNGIGWQMTEGRIVTRGTETFESNVHIALDALAAAGRATLGEVIKQFPGTIPKTARRICEKGLGLCV
jgi:hypothetical protein